MLAMHSIESLIHVIKNSYELSELYDVNLNFLKKDPTCPDSVTNYLFCFKTNKSLVSRVQHHNDMGAVIYDTTVFHYQKTGNKSIIHQLNLGTFPSKELYSRLEDADFFNKTDMFAITFTLVNDFFYNEPEIYIYVTE